MAQIASCVNSSMVLSERKTCGRDEVVEPDVIGALRPQSGYTIQSADASSLTTEHHTSAVLANMQNSLACA